MTGELCARCIDRERIRGERYCSKCRFAVLREMGRLFKEHEPPRDLSRQGTEEIGRPSLVAILGHEYDSEELDDDSEEYQ